MKKKYKWIVAVIIVLSGLAVWGVSLMRPLPVQTETAVRGNLERSFTVQSEVRPVNSTVLIAPAAGTVKEILFQAGMEVEAGQILLKTDASQEINMDLQMEQIRQQRNAARREYERMYGEHGEAQSAFASAESQYLLAQRNYDSGKVLASGGDLAQIELEILKNEREVAYQQYVQARENLSESRKGMYQEQIASLERQLTALAGVVSPGVVSMPYDGVVWETYVQEGAYLTQNQPVAKVYSMGEMKVVASVLTEDAAFLENGMEAELVYPDGSCSSAEVTFISRTAEKALSSTGIEESRCRVELIPEEMPERLGAGQEVAATFGFVKAEQVLTVPAAAIVPKGKERIVYVIRNGKAVEVQVITGMAEDGRVEAMSGISEGDLIVTEPYESGVKDGRRVVAE